MTFARMRGIVALCVCVVLALAAYPEQVAGNPAKRPDHEIANALNNLTATIEKAQKPSEHDKPCPDRKDDRSSDLCAQWKAADESQRSANVALGFGIFGSIIGAATFAAAMAAAIFAGRAARHTETGAKEAKRSADAAETNLEIMRSEQRPYVYFGDAFVDLPLSPESVVRIKLKNHGSSPALHMRAGAVTDYATRPIGEQSRNTPITHWDDAGSLGPQAETTCVMTLHGVTQKLITSVIRGDGAFVTHMAIRYEGRGLCDFDEVTLNINQHTAKTGEMLVLTEWGRTERPRPLNEQGELKV